MAHCYNCGCNISEDDKTRLCDDCKKILLPFVKFMDASTSSAVRRLVSNENNLRNAGVTDSGMEYLLRICELHDKKKNEAGEYEKEYEQERDGGYSDEGAVYEQPDNTPPHKDTVTASHYSDIEIPLDKPLNLIKRAYGQYLAAVEIVLGVIAAASVIWFLVNLLAWNKIDFIAVVAAMIAGICVYIADCVRRMTYDIEELKKHFR